MVRDEILNIAQNEYNSIKLTDSYQTKRYKNNFNDHLNALTEISLILNKEPDFILRKPRLKMTEDLYYEIEGFVLEELDDVHDSDNLDLLYNLKVNTGNKIREELGSFYYDDSEINSIIDYSVEGFILATKFEMMSREINLTNPWNPSKKILLSDQILHKFSMDMDYVWDMTSSRGSKKIRSVGESEILKETKIGVVAKGRKDGFSTAVFHDMFGMRNIVLDIMKDLAPNSEKPATADVLIVELRKAGLKEDDFSDSQIKSWLIYPLKRMSKIGSSKEGYFLFGNCIDIEVSYFSHLENFKGFMRTLENHRNYALYKGCGRELDEHYNYMKRILTLNNKI